MDLKNELNTDEIKAVTALSELSEEQVSAIVNLSQTVVGRTTKNVYDTIDNDMESIVGERKPEGVKTLTFIKDKVASMSTGVQAAGKIPELTSQIKTYKDTIAKMEADLKSGGSEAIQSKLTALERIVQDKDGEIKLLRDNADKTFSELQDKYRNEVGRNTLLERKRDITQGISGLPLKDTIPQSLVTEAIDIRMTKAFEGITSEWDGDKLVHRRDGEIVRNPENANHPSTSFDILKPLLSDLIAEDKVQTGGGARPTKMTALTTGQAKTQVEADKMIAEYLMESEGLSRGTEPFTIRAVELRTEAKVQELPLR